MGRVGEIDKTVTATATAEIKIKWILADSEPTAPEGYVRYPDLDINLGELGTLYAFRATS